jgi:hypothetical protein
MNSGGCDEFAHRQNADGTFDSICLSCYLTITTAETEPELVLGESQHSCPADSSLHSTNVEDVLRPVLVWKTLDQF